MTSFGLKILDGPLAGEWVQTFDPDASAYDPPRYPTGSGSSTADPAKALRFDDPGEALEYWHQPSTVVPLRPDGKPNRPLTAFTVTVEELPEEVR